MISLQTPSPHRIWTNKELDTAYQFGLLLFSIEQLRICLELDAITIKKEFDNDKSPLYLSYHRGKLETELLYRKNILNSAINGSVPAQNLITEWMKKLS